MTRRLVATYLVLAAIVLVALEVPLGIVNERNQRRDLQQRVERDAVALAALVEDTLQSGSARPGDALLRRVVRDYGASTGARVVVVDPGGRALADSDDERELGRDFSTRPEIADALDGRVATGTRRSDTLDEDLLYVAVPVASGGEVHGAVRASVPTSRLDSLVRRYWLILGGVALVVLAAVAVAGLWLARWVTRPLTDLRDATRQAEAGDLSVRADDAEGPEEVRELASAFNDMVGRLDALVGTQEKFVADASHQLRSPLTALRLRIENLQHDAGAAGREDLEGALGEVDRLSRLVNGLLALARAERRAAERAPQDVGALVRERADAWRAAAGEGGVGLRAEAPAGLTATLAPGALEQVLDNLVANALAVAPAGTEVTLAAGRDGRDVEVTVTDAGPGMSPEDRESAFDRFWRGREDRRGSGLGLAIVRSLVEADGGTVRLEEASGGGLRAVVRVPAATPAPALRT
ncbi:MAG: ATP-binding protein [Thermoleophilia bacterium]